VRLNLEQFVRFGLNMLLHGNHTTCTAEDEKPDITIFAFLIL
jgi:hypothetical protein